MDSGSGASFNGAEGDQEPAVRGVFRFVPLAVQSGRCFLRFCPGLSLVPGESHHGVHGLRLASGDEAKLVAPAHVGADDLDLTHLGLFFDVPVGCEIFFRPAPLHISVFIEGKDGLVIIEIGIMEEAHPFINESSVLLEPGKACHGHDGDHRRFAFQTVKSLKFRPGLAFISGKRAFKTAGGVRIGPFRVCGNEDQLVRGAVGEFQPVYGGGFQGIFPAGRRVLDGVGPADAAVMADPVKNGAFAVALGVNCQNVPVFQEHAVRVGHIIAAVVHGGEPVEVGVPGALQFCRHPAEVQQRDGVIAAGEF